MVKRFLCLGFLSVGLGLTNASVAQSIEQSNKADFFDNYIYSGKISERHFPDTVIYRNVNNWVVLKVTIKGNAFHFILDTGAPTAISKGLAKKLRLKPVNAITVADAAGKAEVRDLYRLPTLQIGNTVFDNEGCFATDLSQMSQISCFQIDGIIGANLMRKCGWLIDFPRGRLVINDSLHSMRESVSIPFEETDGGMPQIGAQLDDTTVHAIFDTGLGGLSVFSRRLLNVANSKNRAVSGFGLLDMGILGNRKGEKSWVRVGAMMLGSVRLDQQVIEIGAGETNLIGTGLLQGYQVGLDWTSKRIFLERMTVETENMLHSFGFSYVWDDSKIVVSFVWEGTDAFVNNIAEGDQLIGINGRETSRISHEEFCDLKVILEGNDRAEFTIKQQDGLVKSISLDRIKLL